MAEEKRTFLPECWNNDDVMNGFMSMAKARQVNPLDYDRKIKFWTDLISTSSRAEKNAVCTIEQLKQRFQRNRQVPACLNEVCSVMLRSGDLVTMEEWTEKHSTWSSWSFSQISKTTSWLFGSANASQTKYIHIPTIKHQAQQCLEVFVEKFKSDIDATKEVVAYSEFYDSIRPFISTKANFDIVLQYLCDNGDVTVGYARSGEQILKFRDTSSDGPVTFTEADASVHDIRNALSKLDKDMQAIEQKISKLDADCRAALRSGEKTKAANLLRQKKRQEKELVNKDGQYQQLVSMLDQLSNSKHHKVIVDAYKVGSSAMKKNLAVHGLSPEKVDTTMDEVMSALDEYKEIQEVMSQHIGTAHDATEELEQELNDLLTADVDKHVANLPNVPSTSIAQPATDSDADALEKRWQRLRASAM